MSRNADGSGNSGDISGQSRVIDVDAPVAKKAGRPSKYTPELGRSICAVVEERGFLSVAAEACGVHRHTAEAWRDKGLAGDELYADFAVDLLRAKAKWTREVLGMVEDPRWLLERADPEFRPPARSEITGAGGGPIQHEHAVVAGKSDAELLRIIQGAGQDDDSDD